MAAYTYIRNAIEAARLPGKYRVRCHQPLGREEKNEIKLKKELEILLLNSIQTIYSRVLNLRVLLLFGGVPVELMLSRKKAIEITHTETTVDSLSIGLPGG